MNRYTTTFNTWNKIASVYQDTFMELDLYDDTYDIFCNHLSKKNAAILEIGCGPGNITKYLLLKNSRFNIKAIDAAAIQYANIGVGITSGAIVYKGSYLRSNELYHIQKNGRIITRWSKTAKGLSYWKNIFAKQSRLTQLAKVKGIRAIGNKLGIVAGALTVYDVIDTGQIKPSHVINSVMIGASFTGVGAIVLTIYFVADFGTYLFTGKGIGNRIDEYYGSIYDFRE